MDDLETRLKDILEADASRAPLVATPPVGLRPRVRRRQARSAIAGATAFLVVAGVVGAATWAGLSRRQAIPAGNDVPMRVTVDRFTVDVPAGWTALDTSFTPLVMATETETCSFSAEATPVTGGAATGAGQELEESPDDQQRCTSEPVRYPAGLPLLQLTQRDVSDLDQTECGTRLGEGRDDTGANAFADDAAGVYLALLPGVTGLPPWPVALQDGDGPCGEGSYARFSVGNDAYLAFAGFGPEVTPEARDALLAAIADMGVHAATRPDLELPIGGPAVFLASGELEGTRWQISAGVALDASARNVPTAWAELVSTDGTITDTLDVRWNGDGPTAASMSLHDREIALALLPDSAVEPAWESDDGTMTELSTAAAPAIMALPPTPFSGRVGWAVAPGGPGTLAGRDAVGARVEPSYEPAPSRPIEGSFGRNDWYAWWTLLSPTSDGSRLRVFIGRAQQPRSEFDLVWDGTVPASAERRDGTLNAIALSMNDRAPEDSALVIALVPPQTSAVHLGFADDAGGTQARREYDVPGQFVDLPSGLTSFSIDVVGTSFPEPVTVTALDADLGKILTVDLPYEVFG